MMLSFGPSSLGPQFLSFAGRLGDQWLHEAANAWASELPSEGLGFQGGRGGGGVGFGFRGLGFRGFRGFRGLRSRNSDKPDEV